MLHTVTRDAEVGGQTPTEESSVDGTSLAIVIIVTFLVTAIAVGFLGVVVGLVLQTHFNRKKERKTELSNGYLSSHTTEEKTSL